LARHDDVLVLGLGRFGTAVARELVELGYAVLAVDARPERVQDCSIWLQHVVQSDATSIDAMRELGAEEFDTAVIAIGNSIEASVLATSVMIDLGIERIWAKAITSAHGRILERVGAHRVVFPERDMGARVAHMLVGRTMEYVKLDAGFALAELPAPAVLVGRTLSESAVRRVHDVNVVAVKPSGADFTYAEAATVIREGDIVVVTGRVPSVESFLRL
jgi:trk system potassium uptake protein TrkA